MRKIEKLSAIFIMMALIYTNLYAQDSDFIADSKIWSLKDCLKYGLKHHPKVIMADSDVKIQEAALLNTESSFDPKLSASMNLGNSKENRIGDNAANHSNHSQSESISISKKLYDSGKHSLQMKQSKEALESAKKDRETTLIDLAANIKTMFFKAQQAQSILQVKLETLEGYEKHLKKVESYVEVGTHPPYDITKAQVDVANARVDLISAKSTLKQALVNIANAIGMERPIFVASYQLEELPQIDESVKLDFVKIAQDRPEVKSSEARLRAAEYKIKEARTSLKPTVSTSAGYSWSRTHTPQDHGWNVGLGVSWTLYDGRTTKASIDSAKNSYKRTKASLDNLKLNIDMEVENCINDIIDSVQRVKANEILVKQSKESLELAESRYDAGLGSPLEITDARVDFEKAKGNLIKAYFDCLIAQAKLDNTLGRMPEEYSLDKAVEELNKREVKEKK